jgi:hypothetical protein
MMVTLVAFTKYSELLREATITNQTDYGPGHKLVLRKTANKVIAAAMGKDIEISSPVEDAEILQIGKGRDHVFLKTNGKVIKVVGSASTINNAFNHAGGGKSDTHKTTRCKEAMSVIVFRHFLENGGLIDEEDAIDLLKDYDADSSVYKTIYYTSATLQLSSFKKIKKLGKMIFEFQGETHSAKIYAKSKVLGAPSNPDNWNPSDIWLFDSGFASTIDSDLKDMQHIQELNLWIRRNYILKNIVPISLKQAAGKSSIELIEPIKYKDRKLKYDFSLNKVQIAGTCKSVFIETKSGFTFKANARAAKTNPNLFYEGTMKGENFSMGAIDKTSWDAYHKGAVPNGKDIKPTNALLKNAARIYKKYNSSISKKDNDVLFNPNFREMDILFQQRYIHCADFLDFIMSNYEESMKFGFYASMKVSAINSMYLKIK